MSKPSEQRATQAIIEAANEWLLAMHEEGVSAAEEQAFADWLRESPVHVREYLKAEAVFASLESVDIARRIDVEALLASSDDTVVELQSPVRSSPSTGRTAAVTSAMAEAERGEGANTHTALWAAAATVLLVIAAVFWYSTLPRVDVYTTGLGEQRRLVLEDGSIIDMNTQSELTVRMTKAQRSIDLVEGEALFTVARDSGRPFVVASDHATVRALGTQFNVHKRNGEVLVTVLEGRVAVEHTASLINSSGPAVTVEEAPVELGVGDAAEVLPAAPIRTVDQVNIERTVAWTERRLIFDDEPLSAVVAEFNRYNPRQLVISDVALSQERISAVFDADQPDALVRFLEQNAGIVVRESQSQLVLQLKE